MGKIYLAFICTLQLIIVNCQSQVPGCTDPLANNFDPSATVNDGSCSYDPASVAPESTFPLSGVLAETSGLIVWDDYVWTHNDNTDTVLYGLDTLDANIAVEYPLEGVVNVDWEEISQDEEYIYMGDFGNNGSGNRTDLRILRIEKASLKSGSAKIDTLWYSYEDQSDFSPQEPNLTDYDCEAMVVAGDSIFLFTKQWINGGTNIYSIPRFPGTHIAHLKSSYKVLGLVTGATYMESKQVLVLSGYTGLLSPFFYLFYDFTGQDFLSGNKRKITASLPFHQVEGIATMDGLKYYVSNENFARPPIANNPQKLHVFDLSSFLENYLLGTSGTKNPGLGLEAIHLYPNPVRDLLYLESALDLSNQSYEIIDYAGRQVRKGRLPSQNHSMEIEIDMLSAGLYFLRIMHENGQLSKSFVVED